MELRSKEALDIEVLRITNDTLQPGQNYNKMYGKEARYNDHNDDHNAEAQTYNIPRYNEPMSTRDKRQMRNWPTRIKILQFCKHRTTSQLTAHYNAETETIDNCPLCFKNKVL